MAGPSVLTNWKLVNILGLATTIWGYFKEKSCAIGKNAFVCVTRVLHAEGIESIINTLCANDKILQQSVFLHYGLVLKVELFAFYFDIECLSNLLDHQSLCYSCPELVLVITKIISLCFSNG